MTPKRKFLAAMITAGFIWNSSAATLDIPPEIINEVQQHGTARVIVELDVPWQPEGMLRGADAVVAQRQQLTDTQQQFVTTLSQDLVNSGLFDAPNSADGTPIVKPEATYETIPYLVLEVSEATLPLVQQQTLTKGVTLDHADEPSLTQSLPLIGADKAWSAGYTGQGQQIAVLDTGVEKTHPFFATNRVVQEACFSATFCPDGQKQQVSAGAAVPCNYDAPNCLHGTHVAGIAASVAKDAQLIAVQVFSKQLGTAKSLQSDQLLALDWLQRTYGNPDSKLAAVNLSLGGGKFASACDDDPRKKAIDNLRSVGIATIVSSGNNGYTDGIGAPACISSAISVGATDKSDNVASFSNSASLLHLLAPGVDIVSSVTGGKTLAMSGTSMAAPHVAGAWAVLKAAKPTATVDELLTTLQSTGKAVTGKGVTKVRVQLDKALPPPAIAADCEKVKEGLVACYPFDGDAKDYSGNGHDGVIQGGLNYPDGVSNKAASFNGTTKVLFPSIGSNYFSGDFSINFYLKSSLGQLSVLAKRTSCDIGNFFDLRGGSSGIYFETYTLTPRVTSYSMGKVVPNQWNFVSVMRKGTNAIVYINGLMTDQKTAGSILDNTAVLGISNSPCIGVDGTGMLTGELDDLRIYNRALSEAEIKQLYGKETLTVTKTGNGNVTATGINCGTDCTEDYAKDSTLTLTAVPIAYATFTGWSGDCTGTGTTVNVTMDKAKSCAANFSSTLTNPANGHAYQFINWGMYWQDGVNYCASQGGYLTTITSQSEQDFVFNNFCAGKSMCLLGGWQERKPRGWRWITGEAWTYSHWKPSNGKGDAPVVGMYGVMGSAKNAYPSFWNDFEKTDVGFPICEWNPPVMTLTVAKTGNGKVTGQGINCGTDCAENYAKGSSVTLTAVPVTGATFTGWSGDCTGTDTTVNLTMDKAKNCVATFSATITNSANGHTYQLVNQGMNWSQGKDYCASQGGYLTTITSQSEQDFVFNNLCAGNFYCLLGGTNDGQVGKWRWITNESWGYTHWTPGNPNNAGGNETVLGLYGMNGTSAWQRASFWEDGPLSSGGFPICEWDAPKVTLTVTKTGNGQITGNGITCGTDCTEANLVANTQVTLTATPDAGNQFAGWAGACTGTEATTTVTMTADQTCEAKFMPAGIPLTVKKADVDNGRISGRLRGETTVSLTCDNACQTASYNYPKDGVVILTATADPGYEFKTWTCTGSSYTPGTQPNIIKVTMTTTTTCTANFDVLPGALNLTVHLIGTGMGSVTPSKGGLDCQGTQCTGAYATGSKVLLTAKPSPFSTFVNWGGDCTGNSLKVTVTLTKDVTCTVQFQSVLETAAAELVNLLYTDGFLTNNADVASQFPLASNQDRLQEAFWLASTAILQADSHLAATQEWPTQLTGTQWYSKTPIGKYTQSIQLQPGESVDVRVKLLDPAGMEQEVVIVIYYGTTPPIPAGDGGSGRQSIPIYFPASFFARWYG